MDYNLKYQTVNNICVSCNIYGNGDVNKLSNDPKPKGMNNSHDIKLQGNDYYFLVPFDMQNMME
jgi:hypothetical protein